MTPKESALSAWGDELNDLIIKGDQDENISPGDMVYLIEGAKFIILHEGLK